MSEDKIVPTGKGLLEEMRNTFTLPSEAKLEKLIEDLFFSGPPSQNITILTGFMGMVCFDFNMAGFGSPPSLPRGWFYFPHKHTGLVISLDKKEGMLKIHVKKSKYELRLKYGTTLIATCRTFEEIKVEIHKLKNTWQ